MSPLTTPTPPSRQELLTRGLRINAQFVTTVLDELRPRAIEVLDEDPAQTCGAFVDVYGLYLGIRHAKMILGDLDQSIIEHGQRLLEHLVEDHGYAELLEHVLELPSIVAISDQVEAINRDFQVYLGSE